MRTGTRVQHKKHGSGVVEGQGLVAGTVLVRFDSRDGWAVKVIKCSKLEVAKNHG